VTGAGPARLPPGQQLIAALTLGALNLIAAGMLFAGHLAVRRAVAAAIKQPATERADPLTRRQLRR
jgi:hypothetical protein